jgi:DNA processing protein
VASQAIRPLLAATADAPPRLFVRGNADVLNVPAIAIVGSREASSEGRARAYRLAYFLTKRGFTIASGLARGIDTSAHIGALDAGGTTFAVIGTPLNRCYPSENAELQRRIAHVGAVVSQFSPTSKKALLLSLAQCHDERPHAGDGRHRSCGSKWLSDSSAESAGAGP